MTKHLVQFPGFGVRQVLVGNPRKYSYMRPLVLDMDQEAELLYRTVQWNESLIQSAGKTATGLPFDIKCSKDAAVSQLHLPHCETNDALLVDGLLSVVHITDDGMSILKPLEITDTHREGPPPIHGPNFYPTFEVLLRTNPQRVTLMVQDQEGREVWKREVPLTGYFSKKGNSCS